MNDEMFELLTTMKTLLTEVRSAQAEHTQRFDRVDRDLASLHQEVGKVRNKQFAQEVILDDIQDQARAIVRAMDDLRQPAVKPIGAGGIAEIRQLNSELNALQRKHAELQARIEILEGTREP